jgi:hypothetical protein
MCIIIWVCVCTCVCRFVWHCMLCSEMKNQCNIFSIKFRHHFTIRFLHFTHHFESVCRNHASRKNYGQSQQSGKSVDDFPIHFSFRGWKCYVMYNTSGHLSEAFLHFNFDLIYSVKYRSVGRLPTLSTAVCSDPSYTLFNWEDVPCICTHSWFILDVIRRNVLSLQVENSSMIIGVARPS